MTPADAADLSALLKQLKSAYKDAEISVPADDPYTDPVEHLLWSLLLWAAKATGRPVKWMATRQETFLADHQAIDDPTQPLAVQQQFHGLLTVGFYPPARPLARGKALLRGARWGTSRKMSGERAWIG